MLHTYKRLPVVIAFTNLALDHLLTSILDAKITTNIVRLGSRRQMNALRNIAYTTGTACGTWKS
jgi:hypothetical protein